MTTNNNINVYPHAVRYKLLFLYIIAKKNPRGRFMFGNRISRAYRIIRLTERAALASASVALLCITLCVIGGTCIYNRVTYAVAAETVKKGEEKKRDP